MQHDDAEPDLLLNLLAQEALRRIAVTSPSSATVRIHTVFDPATNHYLLVAEGWQGYRRVYRTLAHIAVAGGMILVHEDGTVAGVVEDLRAVGVPRAKIVCEWSVVPDGG